MTQVSSASPLIEILDSDESGQQDDAVATGSSTLLSSSSSPSPFAFEEVKDYPWTFQSSRKSRDLFDKWNLTPGLRAKCFRITRGRLRCGRDEDARLLRYLLADPSVASSLNLPSPSSSSSLPAGEPTREGGEETEIRPLSCLVLNMNFFRPLFREGILTEDGHVRGCMDEDMEGILVQDRLRSALIAGGKARDDDDTAEDVHRSAFTDEERDELIYHVLRLVCVGGSMCQAEETFEEWRDATRDLYKDMVSTQKKKKCGNNSEGGAGSCDDGIEVTSPAYWIDPEGRDGAVFSRSSVHNKCFAVVDRVKRTVKVVYKQYEAFW